MENFFRDEKRRQTTVFALIRLHEEKCGDILRSPIVCENERFRDGFAHRSSQTGLARKTN